MSSVRIAYCDCPVCKVDRRRAAIAAAVARDQQRRNERATLKLIAGPNGQLVELEIRGSA